MKGAEKTLKSAKCVLLTDAAAAGGKMNCETSEMQNPGGVLRLEKSRPHLWGAVFLHRKEMAMEQQKETRVAVMGIIVEDLNSATQLNQLLHEYGCYIIGRMGIPYREKGVSIVSVAIDAPQDVTAALSGKIGRLPGISVKTAYSNVVTGGTP